MVKVPKCESADCLFADVLVSWQRSLRASNKSDNTILTYSKAVVAFCRWAHSESRAASPALVTRLDIEDFLGATVERHSASTAATFHRGLQQFFKWFAVRFDAGNPTLGVKPPVVPEKPVPVLTEADLRRILDGVSGDDFESVRDAAMLLLFIDAGPRRSELGEAKLAGIDWDDQTVEVLGKGRRIRRIPFGNRTAAALRRYLSARQAHPKGKGADALWIGSRGAMTPDGVYQVIVKRAGINPHAFRHTMAHRFRLDGGNADDLMAIAGWKSPRMLNRYGASAAAERARTAHRRYSLGDRV